MKPVDFSKKYPIQFVQDGVIANGNGDVTLMFELQLQSVFTRDEQDFNALNQQLAAVFKTLPTGTLIHQLDFVWPSRHKSDFNQSSDFATYSDLKSWHLKPVLRHSSYLAITLSERKSKPFGTAVQSAIFNSFDYLFSNKPFKGQSKLNAYTEIFETFETLFQSINNIALKKCDTTEILKTIYKLHSWDFDFNQQEGVNWLNHTLPPVRIDKTHFTVGDKHFGVISMDKQGHEVATSVINKPANRGKPFGTSDQVALPVSFNYPLTLGLPIQHVVSTSIEIIDNDIAATALDHQSGWLKFLKGVSHAAATKYESNQKFKHLLYDADFQAVNLGVNVIIAENSESQLAHSSNLTKQAFTQMQGATAWVENLECFPAYMYSLPGNRKDWERNKLTVMEAATCYLTKESHFKGGTEGFYYLDRYGHPVKVNFWYNGLVNNVNMVIIGPSGSGKSYFANGLLQKCLADQDEIIIIDDGDSYERLCKDKGKYFDSRNKASLGVNIFHWKLSGDQTIDEELLQSRRNLIFSIIKTIWRGSERISNDERAVLKVLIHDFVQPKTPLELRTAAGFKNYLEDQANKMKRTDDVKAQKCDLQSLLITLQPFIAGEYQWVFETSQNEESYHDQLMVFSLAGISDDEILAPIYTLIVIDQIINKVKRLPLATRKRLFIDEAWKVLDGDMKEYVEYSFRTMRKMNAQVCIITQNAADIEHSSISDAIKINTDIKVLLSHGHNINEDMQLTLRKTLGLNSADLALLESIQPSPEGGRELFIKMGDHAFVLINQVSPESNLMFTTHAAELAQLKHYKAKFEDDDFAAINEMTYQQKQEGGESGNLG